MTKTEKAAKVYKLLRDLKMPEDDAFYAAVELVRLLCPEEPLPAEKRSA